MDFMKSNTIYTQQYTYATLKSIDHNVATTFILNNDNNDNNNKCYFPMQNVCNFCDTYWLTDKQRFSRSTPVASAATWH